MANDLHCVWVYLIYPQGALWFSFSSSSWGRWLLLALWNNSFVIFLLRCVLGDGLIAKLCPTLATPWPVACQAPLSMGFSRQESWSGLPFPSPEDLPNPGIEPGSPTLQADSLLMKLQGKPEAWEEPKKIRGSYHHKMRHNPPHSQHKAQPFPMLKKGLRYVYHKVWALAFFSTFIKQTFLPSKSKYILSLCNY